MVTDMLQDPQSPDKDIAPLVSTWVKKLATKADKLERTIEEKDILIIRLEEEHERVEAINANSQTKIRRLESRLSRMEPASNNSQDEVSALKAQVQQISADKELETQKVEKLNNQLSVMVRQLMTKKKEHENSMSRQASTAGAEAELKDLKAKHEVLNQVAMDVVKHGGIFASNNLGEFGAALLKLKEHMEQ
jgi:chromosome segregation ATPase